MSKHHEALVVRVPKLQKHPNADSLSIVMIDGYQVVLRTEQIKQGELAVYIAPDSVVPQRPEFAFLWGDQEFADGIVPEKKRRVTVRRFRGEYSEGLLMPISDFTDFKQDLDANYDGPVRWHMWHPFLAQGGTKIYINEGHDLSDVLSITHYNPPEPVDDGTTEQPRARSKTLKGFIYRLLRKLTHGRFPAFYTETEKTVDSFRPEYDVEAFKKFPRALEEGEEVLITEKIHGSNARYTFQDGRMYVGTRKTWKLPESDNVWTRVLKEFPAIEEFCRTHPGYTVYGEVVPTQKGYDYGFTSQHPGFFAFDFMQPNGSFVNLLDIPAEMANPERDWNKAHSYNEIPKVPVLFRGGFNLEAAKALAEGPSTVKGNSAPGLRHMREGCVVRPYVDRYIRGLGRVHLKIVSNAFLEKDNK